MELLCCRHSRRHATPTRTIEQLNEEPPNPFLSLPVDLLVYIVSLIPARDKVKLQFVSRRLRSVSETPSLWREFVWPYYHPGDEDYVNNVLKMYGRHVKCISFPRHVIPSKTIKMLKYCINMIELSLPSTKLDPEQLEIFSIIRNLQRLDVQWDVDIRQLLEPLSIMNLKELTVRMYKVTFTKIFSSTRMWVNFWILKRLVPQKLNIIVKLHCEYFVIAIWKSWIELNHNSPTDHDGCVNLYSSLKVPLNLTLAVPEFQINFSQTCTSPFVRCRDVGLMGLNSRLLLLIDYTSGSREIHKAKLIQEDSLTGALVKDHLNPGVVNLEFVTEFCVSFFGFSFDHLEQFASTCPNLQRLNLCKNTDCLKFLRGLRAIANSCHNLQGLNLLGIPVTEVEDQAQLWEILSDMKLTHLAVEMCVLLPSVEDKEKLTSLFQKCMDLQALESRYSHCDRCALKFVDKIQSVLSHFPLVIHYLADSSVCHHRNSTALQEILTHCKRLKYLYFYSYGENTQGPFIVMPYLNLQQLCLKFTSSNLPDSFMTAISSHGGLVHVVLSVRSVTSEGVTVLVRNSPNLLTLFAVVYGWIYDASGVSVQPKVLQTVLKEKFPHRRLFATGFADDSVSVLSQFKALMHYIVHVSFHHSPISLQDTLTNCKELKYLNYTTDIYNSEKFCLSTHHRNLQQIRIKSASTIIPNSFMTAISSHGGLVHVVLCVRSVTSEGITVLVRNSPNLLMFHAILHVLCDRNGSKLRPIDTQASLKQEFSHRQLFIFGSFLLKLGHVDHEFEGHFQVQDNTDLFSVWDYSGT